MISTVEEMISLEYVLSIEEKYSSKAEELDVKLYALRYKCDNCEVVGYIAVPADYVGEQYPALIFNRGGNREFGVLNPDVIVRMASNGFVAMGSQYRGNCGGTGCEEYGGADINDVLQLVDLAESIDFARRGGVYMVGHSRGGMMTYIACSMIPDRIKAAAILAGIADCIDSYESREQDMKDVFIELIGGTPIEYPSEYAKRSATYFAKKIKVPMIIMHGTNDWRVNLSQSVRMHELLNRYGTDNKLIIYQGADHTLRGYPTDKDMLEWFAQYGYMKKPSLQL